MSKSTIKLYHEIAQKAASEPLSRLLPSMLTLARRINNPDLENWVRLEMGGYLRENPAMNDDVVVPAYRTIAGQRSDEFGRPLIISDPELHFVNEDRIRSGVAELEHLARSRDMLTIRNPAANEIIRKQLGVEVTRFTFHPSAIAGVLSNIRSRLLDWLSEIQPDIDRMAPNGMEETSDSETGPAWRYTLLTASIVAMIVSVIWFLNEPGFEPLGGLVAGVVGLIIHRRTSSKILDLIVSIILIVLVVAGVVMVFRGR
ncbi:MAG TPA: hypothetical protein ENI39_05800 [Anaerolineae bacterium]|nr:hypothetical protein [Anaerolineae bacterium]